MKFAAVILLLASLPALAQDIPDNAQGFDQQFRSVIDSVRNGDRYGSFTDPFGHTWGVASRKEELTKEEVSSARKTSSPPWPIEKVPKCRSRRNVFLNREIARHYVPSVPFPTSTIAPAA